MKIRSKLLINALVSIFCLIVTGGTGYYYTDRVAKVSMSITETQAIPLIKMNRVEKDTWEILFHLIVHIGVYKPDDVKKIEHELENLYAVLAQDLNACKKGTQAENENVSAKKVAASAEWLKKFEETWTAFDAVSKEALELSRDYAKEDALQLLIGKGRDAYDGVLAIFHQNSEKARLQMTALGENAVSTKKSSLKWIFLFTLIIGCIVFSWGLFISHSIVKAIAHARQTVQDVAHGDLSVRWELKSDDELGQLGESLNLMADNLEHKSFVAESIAAGDLTHEVQLSSDKDVLGKSLQKMILNLRNILNQIGTAGYQVNTGSKQVSGATQSLSQGTNEQASSLEEISSSMIQIGSQTRANAENAFQANQLVTETRHLAEKGMKKMADMMTAMEKISTASWSVVKIIKVIDEIAFQTNLLSLNAAVEAARVGRLGKGFAVVAGEVRNLAGRSAKAAKETAELIEGAIGEVENGNKIARETAESLNSISESVIKASDRVAEIAASSDEQAQAIDQVNQGIAQVEQVTQQNAADAQETAAATEELSAQASQLREILSQFQLDKSDPSPQDGLIDNKSIDKYLINNFVTF